MSPLARDLRLAAELGLDSHIAWNDPEAFRSLVASAADSSSAAEYTEIPIDHEDPSVGTYRNRFWVTEKYYTPGSPVMVYDIGENTAQYSVSLLTNSSSWLSLLLREFNAIGILWEHRYYGDSLPFPVGQDMPLEHFQYLTTKQALADIPYFAANFSRASHPTVDLTPEGSPWIMIGGSYPGIRAAFTRDQYPDTIFAAFASSAPVQAQVDMGVYFEQVYRAMVANGYSNCTKDIHAALRYIDNQLAGEETAASIKRLFLGPEGEKSNNEDFTSALSALYGPFQSHGLGGGNQSLDSFCNYLELDPRTNRSAGPGGLAPVYGDKYAAERWASFPSFIPLVNRVFGTNCGGLDTSRPPTCEFNLPNTEPDLISWTWQYCSEWGFFQTNNFGPHALLSRYQTLEYQQELCHRQLPSAAQTGLLPAWPQTESLNNEFGGWTIRPSNVYFSGGEFDPWRPLSVLSDEAWAPPGVNYTTEIPACGVSTSEDTVFGYILKNAVHCPDLKLTAEAAVSRGYFIQALKQWLPCFQVRDRMN